ncbi:MAG TPA: response regulator [Dictyobacter sp.]|jgi:DNA-binding response OmpR family regulator|nr:response regulator [Dictyobacter sp.]
MHDKIAVSLSGCGNMSFSHSTLDNDQPDCHIPTQSEYAGLQIAQHVLVVEDDSTLAALEATFLRVHGYIVITVHSGELALSTLRRSPPDLVVLDLELAGSIQGWDVLQDLRTFTTIPVLITTSARTAVRQHIRTSGETRLTLDHLLKPYPMQTLLKRVKRMLPIPPSH